MIALVADIVLVLFGVFGIWIVNNPAPDIMDKITSVFFFLMVVVGVVKLALI
jgi:uncharacterized membrane protein